MTPREALAESMAAIVKDEDTSKAWLWKTAVELVEANLRQRGFTIQPIEGSDALKEKVDG